MAARKLEMAVMTDEVDVEVGVIVLLELGDLLLPDLGEVMRLQTLVEQ